jgi:ATP-dependent RNA helicase DDX23/PRP28
MTTPLPVQIELTEEEQTEAKRLAEVAERAEAKALKRKLQDMDTRVDEAEKNAKRKEKNSRPSFMSKKEREEAALARLESRREQVDERKRTMQQAHDRFVSGRAEEERRRKIERERERELRERERREREEKKEAKEHEAELTAIRSQYLGKKQPKRRIVKPSEKFARIFQFDWDETEDTSKDFNPLYSDRMQVKFTPELLHMMPLTPVCVLLCSRSVLCSGEGT